MRKWTGLDDVPLETIEFQRLLRRQADQDAIAVGVQYEVFIIVDHRRS
jgi:hypothetical protein